MLCHRMKPMSEPTQSPETNELKELIKKYGCPVTESPYYVIVGEYNCQVGILACATNEVDAMRFKKAIDKSGDCVIEITEFNPYKNPTFNVTQFLQKLKEKAKARAKIAKKDS